MQTSDEPIRHCTKTTCIGAQVRWLHPSSPRHRSIDRAQFDEEHDTIEYCYVFGNFNLPSDYVLLECTSIKHNLRHCFCPATMISPDCPMADLAGKWQRCRPRRGKRNCSSENF